MDEVAALAEFAEAQRLWRAPQIPSVEMMAERMHNAVAVAATHRQEIMG